MSLGLALSGGGVKGSAHIGVLKALEENNVKINYIGGTSSGSIVSTLYAVGFSPDEIYEILVETETYKLRNEGEPTDWLAAYQWHRKLVWYSW